MLQLYTDVYSIYSTCWRMVRFLGALPPQSRSEMWTRKLAWVDPISENVVNVKWNKCSIQGDKMMEGKERYLLHLHVLYKLYILSFFESEQLTSPHWQARNTVNGAKNMAHNSRVPSANKRTRHLLFSVIFQVFLYEKKSQFWKKIKKRISSAMSYSGKWRA